MADEPQENAETSEEEDRRSPLDKAMERYAEERSEHPFWDNRVGKWDVVAIRARLVADGIEHPLARQPLSSVAGLLAVDGRCEFVNKREVANLNPHLVDKDPRLPSYLVKLLP